jgi:hypothetical protein
LVCKKALPAISWESHRKLSFSARLFGTVVEGLVAAEILNSQVNQGGRKELYYFRDHQGLEVDFLLPRPNAGLWLIECKAGKTVRPAMAAPLLALRRTMEKRSTRLIVVCGKSHSAQNTSAVARGVEAIELERFVASLPSGHKLAVTVGSSGSAVGAGNGNQAFRRLLRNMESCNSESDHRGTNPRQHNATRSRSRNTDEDAVPAEANDVYPRFISNAIWLIPPCSILR